MATTVPDLEAKAQGWGHPVSFESVEAGQKASDSAVRKRGWEIGYTLNGKTRWIRRVDDGFTS